MTSFKSKSKTGALQAINFNTPPSDRDVEQLNRWVEKEAQEIELLEGMYSEDYDEEKKYEIEAAYRREREDPIATSERQYHGIEEHIEVDDYLDDIYFDSYENYFEDDDMIDGDDNDELEDDTENNLYLNEGDCYDDD